MYIGRDAFIQDGSDWAEFCLDQLEKAKSFNKGFSWGTEICPGLSIEELIGAVVAAERAQDMVWKVDIDDESKTGISSYEHERYRSGFIDAMQTIAAFVKDKRSQKVARECAAIAKAHIEWDGIKNFPAFVVRLLRQRMHQEGPRRRYLIMRRDGFKCCLCGRSAIGELTLEVDHKLAKSKGGSDDDDNLWTLCSECNRGKSDEPLEHVGESP